MKRGTMFDLSYFFSTVWMKASDHRRGTNTNEELVVTCTCSNIFTWEAAV